MVGTPAGKTTCDSWNRLEQSLFCKSGTAQPTSNFSISLMIVKTTDPLVVTDIGRSGRAPLSEGSRAGGAGPHRGLRKRTSPDPGSGTTGHKLKCRQDSRTPGSPGGGALWVLAVLREGPYVEQEHLRTRAASAQQRVALDRL